VSDIPPGLASSPPDFPPSVRTQDGQGGLRTVVVSTPAATAEIYLQGAHVTAWAPQGQRGVLWMSAKSAYAPGEPLRGGVPVCFPWFGPHPSGNAPLHGFARITDWTVVDVADDGDEVCLTLSLSDTPATRGSPWPHPFQARYTVGVGARLTLSLDVTNVGTSPVTFEEAFHTYLDVADVREASITGLERVSYIDRLVSPERLEPTGEPLTVTAETDRVHAQPGTITVVDPAGGRSLHVTATGSANAVVWNPWIAKSAAMGDFGDDEWQRMVCVETCNVLDGAVTLAPGERHAMAATITATPQG
jgi:D-hexose-6-phosphate mutarotase